MNTLAMEIEQTTNTKIGDIVFPKESMVLGNSPTSAV